MPVCWDACFRAALPFPHRLASESKPASCYWDPGHKGVSRIIVGNLDSDSVILISSKYREQELRDDGAALDAVDKPWHVNLLNIAPPRNEDEGVRWFFGNFSMKEAEGRHKDFFVRYLPRSENKSLQFYEALPESMSPKTAEKKVNEWSRVLPNSQISWSQGQNL